MEPETSHTDVTDANIDETRQPDSAFLATWRAGDAALLQPSNLAISKAQRAWDRKPLNPFSRQRLRVGKVWKRPIASLRTATADAPSEGGRANKRRKARTSLQGLLKPVKKLCLESDFGMGARVLQWEGAESPDRKIATRSTAAPEDMVALSDEEAVEQADEEGDVTVEILDENGTLLDVGGGELVKEQGWEDDADASEVEQEHAFDGTMMHFGDITVDATHDSLAEKARQNSSLDFASDLEVAAEEKSPKPASTKHEPISPVAETGSAPVDSPQPQPDPSGPAQTVALPDGFVSPVKRPHSFVRRSAKLSLGSRRKTLPVQFAPVIVAEEPIKIVFEKRAESSMKVTSKDLEDDQAVLESTDVDDDHMAQCEMPEDEWEDMDDDSEAARDVPDNEAATIQRDYDMEPAVATAPISDRDESLPETYPGYDDQQAETHIYHGAQRLVAQHAEAHPGAKLPLSPVPTIEGQHPRLPLRRSPRRKSSSPLKQSFTYPPIDTSHLIAFTPIRSTPRYTSPSNHPGLRESISEADDSQLEPASPIERAASAPPEEPQMSPQKPARPRVSDDTALLQAFLNRAAESKSSRRTSASKRESETNRRDSDAIRQALASPAKTDVLLDLDPNSPSPRKPCTALVNRSVFDGIDLGSGASEDVQADDFKLGPTTRRGDRAERRSQPSATAAPNRISIRGNTENVVLKRSEAQELAQLTRNNTRKNKGGAVLPPLRLTKLSIQASSPGNTDDAQPSERSEKARGVTWAQTLAEYYQGGEVSESSILSDELNASAPQQHASLKAEGETIPSPPPPSDTPSKPKMRRLKPTRTAATPGNVPSAPPTASSQESDKLPPSVSAPQQSIASVSSTKRRSRIATPAKGLLSSSFLPADVEPQFAATEKKAAPKKKAPTSKLPAPSSTSTSLGQGKENLISSPPKKRTVPTAKTFAPKLDFGTKTQLPPASAGGEESTVPGLASPAKKGRARVVLFGGSMPDFGASVEKTKEEVPGLSSPAKKRTRRAVD